ncbi:MAG: phage major capsid protein [Negativicutes bacterium]|nr:phage major capsid protein [Negativicutes bacterium]
MEGLKIEEMSLEQIIQRLADLKVEVREMKQVEEVDKAIEEKKELLERKAELEALEKRKATAEGLTAGTIKADNSLDILNLSEKRKVDKTMEFNKENVLASKEYRSGWAKSLMGMSLTEVEQRAVGVALTTTSETYVAADVSNNGVNNGGLFIPEDVMTELMARMELSSPFFRDVPKTAVSGYVKFPYRVGGSGAKEVAEGTANTEGQVQWAELTLTVLEVSETIRVTWKLEAMAVDSFINYIIDELAMAIPEKIATDMYYGDGTGTLTGVSASGVFIDGEYNIGTGATDVADIYEAISAGIELLTDPRKRMGAKIYVAQDIMDTMAFARDKDERFMHNPINGVGIQSFGKYPIEVDPFLNDGDFVIGNPRFYRFNWNEGISITKDVSGKSRINDYTGYAVVSGAPQPASFVYGKKSS